MALHDDISVSDYMAPNGGWLLKKLEENTKGIVVIQLNVLFRHLSEGKTRKIAIRLEGLQDDV